MLTLYAVAAEQTHESVLAARRAFLLAVATTFPGLHCAYQPPLAWLPALEVALMGLGRLGVEARTLVLEGLIRLVEADQAVRIRELELLRLCCAVLELPFPVIQAQLSRGEDRPLPLPHRSTAPGRSS